MEPFEDGQAGTNRSLEWVVLCVHSAKAAYIVVVFPGVLLEPDLLLNTGDGK